MSLAHFVQYHNAVPIALGLVLLGSGVSYAAINPESVYGTTQTVMSIDNTYIAYKDLSSYSPRVSITGVTEDDEYYYVAYTFTTIDLDNYVWKDVEKSETMKVSKADLGPYRDLGLYVMEQLKQKIDRELAYLKEVQEIEKKSISQKMVATAYSGLVGALFDDSTEILPGYVPVVVPPTPPASDEVPTGDPGSQQPPEQPQMPQGSIVAQVLGNNPSRVPVGSSYADLGAFAQGHDGDPIIFDTYLDGVRVLSISIDTSKPGTWNVRYEGRDSAANLATAERTIEVYDPNAPAPEVTSEQPAQEAPESEGASESEEIAPLPEGHSKE